MKVRTVLIVALASVGSFVTGQWLVEHVGLWAAAVFVLVLVLVAALIATTRRSTN